MTDKQTDNIIHPRFLVQMPLEKAPEAAKALRKIGVDFVAARDMHLIGFTDNYNEELGGEDAENIRQQINDYLTENNLNPTLPEDELTLEQIQQLLTLAQSEFCWHGFSSVTGLYREDQTWATISGGYPTLFQKKALTT